MLGMVIENIICNLALYQALANPWKSVELTEFVQGIVHDETASLMREYNEVIQMQDERIAVLKAEVDRLERERMESAVEQCAEVKAIYQRHCAEMKELHEQHSAEIKTLRSELNISRGA
jgi:uncharacterized small protein (DUF1192 family)